MDKNYLVIDNESGYIKNMIVWDGISPYAPEGVTLIDSKDAPIGITFGCKKENNKWYRASIDEETNEEIWTEVVQ